MLIGNNAGSAESARGVQAVHTSIVLPPEPGGSTRWHAPFLAALIFAMASCGASDEGQARRSADPDEQVREAAEGPPASTPVPATGDLGRVVRNHQGDGDDLEYAAFILDSCGLCPRDPDMDWARTSRTASWMRASPVPTRLQSWLTGIS